MISSCTSEDIEFSDVDEQGSIETTTLDIDEAKSLLQEFVADAFTKSNTSFTIKEHKLKTLYIDNTETLPVKSEIRYPFMSSLPRRMDKRATPW